MDLVMLSRIQFAFTVGFHFLFVPISIGVILHMAIFEILHLKTGKDDYRKLTDFFGNIFIVNYAVGIVTGIGMSIQFGTNWGEYSTFMGDLFGAPLAIEALLAFFLESTFTGIYIFRRSIMSPKFRFVTISLMTLGTSLSALWIITANGFMQNPLGYELSSDGSRIILVDFMAILLNPYAWYILVHTLLASYLLGAMFIMSVSAMKLLQPNVSKEESEIIGMATKISSKTLLLFSVLISSLGGSYTMFIGLMQETKMDMITGIDKSTTGQIVGASFLIMVTLGTIFVIIALYTIIFYKHYEKSTTMKKIYVYIFTLPFIAILTGWIVTEVGRQPWVVYGLMKTSDGVSLVPTSQVWFSLISVFLVNGVLFVLVMHLSKTQIRKSIFDNKYNYKGGN